MGFGVPEGVFFLGGLRTSHRKFVKQVLANAKESGQYTKVVEPCAGSFCVSQVALEAGFKPEQIEASDVMMVSSIIGNYIMGKDTSNLYIHATGFTDEELLDGATALYAHMYLRESIKSNTTYYRELLRDLRRRKDEHIQDIRDILDGYKERLNGFTYTAEDMYEHLDRVKDDPNCIVVLNPPTIKSGYEKQYDTKGHMTYAEVPYTMFDPVSGHAELMNRYKDSAFLLIVHQECKAGETAAEPVFAQCQVAGIDINGYLTSNRPDEVIRLSRGKMIVRPNEQTLGKLNCSILPKDYEITRKSKINVMRIEAKTAQYYRKLWTHTFVGSSSGVNMALFVDGFIAGVFGLDKGGLILGSFGAELSDSMFMMYGMGAPSDKYRLYRLIVMMCQNREVLEPLCTDFEKEKLGTLKTVQMTKEIEASVLRGLMKKTNTVGDKKLGYHLTYMSGLFNRTNKQTLCEFLDKEERWRKQREKAKNKQNK